MDNVTNWSFSESDEANMPFALMGKVGPIIVGSPWRYLVPGKELR